MTSRRDFLKVFTGAAVGAAVLAFVPPVAVPEVTEGVTLASMDAVWACYAEMIRDQFFMESPFWTYLKSKKLIAIDGGTHMQDIFVWKNRNEVRWI